MLWQIVMNARRLASQAWRMKMITLLALLTISSAIWSQQPFRSAYNGAFYCIETLFAFYLVLKFDTEELLSLMMMVGSSLCVLNLITVLFFPRFGLTYTLRDMGAWHGVFSDRTASAKCMVFLLSPAIIFRGRRFNYRQCGLHCIGFADDCHVAIRNRPGHLLRLHSTHGPDQRPQQVRPEIRADLRRCCPRSGGLDHIFWADILAFVSSRV